MDCLTCLNEVDWKQDFERNRVRAEIKFDSMVLQSLTDLSFDTIGAQQNIRR